MEKIISRKVKSIAKNTHNLYKIAENEDVIIHECDLGAGMGMYLYKFKTKAILISRNLSSLEKQILIAHMLGHAFLHPKGIHVFNIKNVQLHKEREANVFALKLLNEVDFWDGCDKLNNPLVKMVKEASKCRLTKEVKEVGDLE